MHHDHLHVAERQPLLAGAGGFEHQLDDLAGVEVAADEFGVGGVLFEGHDGDVVGAHEGVDDGGDAGEEVVGKGFVGAAEGFDEVD